MRIDATEAKKIMETAIKKGWARYPINRGPSLFDSLPDEEEPNPVSYTITPLPPSSADRERAMQISLQTKPTPPPDDRTPPQTGN